jgi:hypothetical protein
MIIRNRFAVGQINEERKTYTAREKETEISII